ncbi:sensor domain-containing protein [Mycobacterium sp. 050272]|uniref:sensor domain-containing protein n=1 Tax=Mycobacterium sp. 050272 TaxID=3142488 RepID=UPI0031942B6E
MVPKDIDSLILLPEVVGEIVGAKLNWASKPPPGFNYPPTPTAVEEGNAECGALLGPDTSTVGEDYTAWRSIKYREEKDKFDHTAFQAVVIVADAKAAIQLLDNAFGKHLNPCNNAVIHRKDESDPWRFQKTDSTDRYARWTATELRDDQVIGWVCSNEARAKNNVVTFAFVCQYGNGAPAAAAILDKISEKIPG